MADVFVSYRREEREAVERLSTALRDLGLTVWFDASLAAGSAFSDEIDREARGANAVLVCWSPAARESRWVKAEALIGFERDALAAVIVAGPDGFLPPTPFNSIHAEDLRAWLSSPDQGHTGWRSVLGRVGRLCNRADLASWGELSAHSTARDIQAWIDAYPSSPLIVAADSMLTSQREVERVRADLEEQTRHRHAVERAERVAREKRESAERERVEERQQREYERVRKREERDATSAKASGFVWLFGVVAIGLLATFTRPNESEMRSAATTILENPSGVSQGFQSLGASLAGDRVYDNYYVASKYSVSLNGEAIVTCWGAFTQVQCAQSPGDT